MSTHSFFFYVFFLSPLLLLILMLLSLLFQSFGPRISSSSITASVALMGSSTELQDLSEKDIRSLAVY